MSNLHQSFLLIFVSILLINCNNNQQTILVSNFDYQNSFFIDVEFTDNIVRKFILDTGSPISVLDSGFVDNNSIKLDSIGSIELGGAGNSKVVEVHIFDNIEMFAFENKINSEFIVIYNLKKTIPIEDEIIGIDFFENRIVEIKYDEQILNILDSESEINALYTKFPLIIKNNKLYVEMNLQINDSISVSGLVMIDTGSEFAISLDRYYSDSLDLFNKIDKKLSKEVKNGGIRGTTYKFLIKGQQALVYDFKINDILISCSKQEHGSSSIKTNRIGTIGNLFLENFDIVFNLADSALYLKPNNNYNTSLNIFNCLFFNQLVSV